MKSHALLKRDGMLWFCDGFVIKGGQFVSAV